MRRAFLSLILALAYLVTASAPALADAPTVGPGPWGTYILCIEGYHAIGRAAHPVYASWGPLTVTCVPDRP